MIYNIPVKGYEIPVRENSLAFSTQSFGNPNPVYINGFHDGEDITSREPETKMTSIYPGFVKEAKWDWDPIKNPLAKLGFGQYAKIWTPLPEGGYYEFLYGHCGWLAFDTDSNNPNDNLDGLLVRAGQKVERGTPLMAIMGTTGFSTGKHTHIRKRKLSANGTVLNYNTPLRGALDPKEDIINPRKDLVGMAQSNVKILKDENSLLLVFALPITDPVALKSYGMNYGKEIPLNPDGTVDFTRLIIDGSFKLQ